MNIKINEKNKLSNSYITNNLKKLNIKNFFCSTQLFLNLSLPPTFILLLSSTFQIFTKYLLHVIRSSHSRVLPDFPSIKSFSCWIWVWQASLLYGSFYRLILVFHKKKLCFYYIFLQEYMEVWIIYIDLLEYSESWLLWDAGWSVE